MAYLCLVEPRMYTTTDFIEQLVTQFPELREDVESEAGLLHNQMQCFTRLSNNAIAARDYEALKRHFVFADRFFHDSEHSLENALYVSYLEDLDFGGAHDERAEALMSANLRQGRSAVREYLDEITGKLDSTGSDSPNV